LMAKVAAKASSASSQQPSDDHFGVTANGRTIDETKHLLVHNTQKHQHG
jgi:hypothetical protein